MKKAPKTVLHLSAIDYGGAGIFTIDFHHLFLQEGHRSLVVVKDKRTDRIDVIQYPDSSLHCFKAKVHRRFAKNQLLRVNFDDDFYFQNRYEFITLASAQRILELIPYQPDIIFIHWVTGFINAKVIGDLQRITGAKIYWLMLDNAPITGGCHYPWACLGYNSDCANCPAILTASFKNWSKRNLAFKLKHLPPDLTLLAFSKSDLMRAKKSIVFQHKEISLLLGVVDESKFTPGNMDSSKAFFGIPIHKKVIFFGASSPKDRRKGMDLLIKAINQLKDKDVFLLVAGKIPQDAFLQENVKVVGHLAEADLIKAYQAAYTFVCPSLEDSGPMMINQAIMCGTPVVAFNTGVAQNLVISGHTGYRAELANYIDLSYGIQQILALSSDDYSVLSNNCRSLALDKYSRSAFFSEIDKIIYNNMKFKSPL